MNEGVRNLGQFGKMTTQKSAIGVESFGLRDGVEHAKPGLRVASGGSGPLPSSVVGGQIVVVQMVRKKAFATTPIDPKMLGQKTATMRNRLCMVPV